MVENRGLFMEISIKEEKRLKFAFSVVNSETYDSKIFEIMH